MLLGRLLLCLAAFCLIGCIPTCDARRFNFRQYERAVEKGTAALSSAKSEQEKAAALMERANALSEKARYGRFSGMLLDQEYEDVFARALKDHEQGIALAPLDADQFYSRGLTYYARAFMGDPMKTPEKTFGVLALEDFNRALGLQENHVMALDYRGLTFISLGDLDKAIVDFERESRLDPKRGAMRLADAYCLRGNEKQKLNQIDPAIADYERSIAASKSRDGCSCDPFGALAALKKGK